MLAHVNDAAKVGGEWQYQRAWWWQRCSELGYFKVSYDSGSGDGESGGKGTSIFFPGELNAGNYTCSKDAASGSVSNTCFCARLFAQVTSEHTCA